MVDYVKIVIPNSNSIRDNPLLDFRRSFNEQTGEIENNVTSEFKNLNFKYYDSGLLIIKGSLHIYHNDGLHNYSQFTKSSLLEVLEDLRNKFLIDLSKAKIQNIEFGVNVAGLSIDIQSLVNGVIEQRGKLFSVEHNGGLRQCERARFIIKIYNKGKKERLKDPLLRYELKFRIMKEINRLGVITLFDLCKDTWHQSVLNLLLEYWDSILIFDHTVDTNKVSPGQINTWSNPHYWSGLNGMQKVRAKKAYTEAILAGSHQIQSEVSKSIDNTWRSLISA